MVEACGCNKYIRYKFELYNQTSVFLFVISAANFALIMTLTCMEIFSTILILANYSSNQVPYNKVSCNKNMATFRTFKGDVSAKGFSINLMRLCATSPCVASLCQWLNHSGAKFAAACGHTTLPVWPCTPARHGT
jgi:hypothetical protein